MSRVGFRVDALVTTRAPDGGRVIVSGWEPGPAGVAALELLGGDALLVADVAEPELLVSLHVPDLHSDGSRRLVDTVLGAGVIDALRGLPGDGSPAVVWRRDDQIRRTTTGQGGLGLIGRLALGVAEVTTAGRSDAAIAVGLVEAGVAAVLLDREISPSPNGLALVRAGVERWDALAAYAFDGLQAPTIDRLVDEARRWATTVATVDDRLGSAIERLARRLRGRYGPDVAATGAMGGARPVEAPAPAAATPTARRVASSKKVAAAESMAPAADEMIAEVEGDARPPAVAVAIDGALAARDDVRIIGTSLDGHHLTVHVGGLRDPRRSWLRVFADDRIGEGEATLLAIAPFEGSGRPWCTAVALVPPDLAHAERLLVDVTDVPSGPWRSARSRSTERAAALGAEAARASRRGGRDAAGRWRACEGAWAGNDDTRRARLAAEYSSAAPVANVARLLVDDL